MPFAHRTAKTSITSEENFFESRCTTNAVDSFIANDLRLMRSWVIWPVKLLHS
jgi:hypothetical protein